MLKLLFEVFTAVMMKMDVFWLVAPGLQTSIKTDFKYIGYEDVYVFGTGFSVGGVTFTVPAAVVHGVVFRLLPVHTLRDRPWRNWAPDCWPKKRASAAGTPQLWDV
jgi:hypothetical protein